MAVLNRRRCYWARAVRLAIHPWGTARAINGLQDALDHGGRPGISNDNASAYSVDMFQEMQALYHSAKLGATYTAPQPVAHRLHAYRDGGDWTSGKIAMRSPRTEPSQSSLAT